MVENYENSTNRFVITLSHKVHFSKQGQKSKKVEEGAPFVVTYHPQLKKLSSIIHRNLYLLYMNEEVKMFLLQGL